MAAITLISVLGAYAAEQDTESEYYLKTFPIARVYLHSLGYKVDFFKQDRTLGSFWLPMEWLAAPGNIGTVVYGKGLSWPYATFFYKEGEVDHFRLYLVENKEDLSWGVLDQGVDYTNQIPAPDSKLIIPF